MARPFASIGRPRGRESPLHPQERLMKQYKLLGLMVVLGSLLLAGPVFAQDYDTPNPEDSTIRSGDMIEEDEFEADRDFMDPTIEPMALDDPYMSPDPLVQSSQSDTITPFGMGLTVGGGVVGFTNSEMRDNLHTGGGWEARATVGTKLPVAFEAAYVGTANRLDTFGRSEERRVGKECRSRWTR